MQKTTPLLKQLNTLMSGGYIDQDVKGRLIASDKKKFPLWKIFLVAQMEIETDLKQITPDSKSLEKKLKYLIKLQDSGTQKYQRFCIKNKTWSFLFFQSLVGYLPKRISDIVKNIFPFNLLFNKLQRATLAKNQYHEYQKYLSSSINELKILNACAPIVEQITPLSAKLHQLFQEDNVHPSKKFKELKYLLIDLNQLVMQLDSRAEKKKLLTSLGLNETLVEALLPDPSLGISPITLITEQFKSSGDYSNFRKLITNLSNAEFANAMFDPLENELLFNVDARAILRLTTKNNSGNNTAVRPNTFETYKGLVVVDLTDIKKLKELQTIVENKPDCRPCALTVKMRPEETLSSDLVDILLNLSQTIPQIRLEGLHHIDFSTMPIEMQERFFQLLPKLDAVYAGTIKITLPANTTDWTDHQIAKLAQFWSAKDLDLRNIPFDQLDRILHFFPCIQNLTLNQIDLTDESITKWNEKGYLQNLIRLDLTECRQLTTNILKILINLPDLAVLNCPNLQLGNQELPKLSNPFDIKLFYCTCEATQGLASQLYKGPDVLASVFQIPLARLGVERVFEQNHTILDPQSVNHWLYRGDFAHLSPQTSIQTIYADNSHLLKDANLPDFISKFPKASDISLYNCRNVTNVGIIEMLKKCPQVKKLDLTCCHPITNQLFSEEFLPFIEKLDEIIISDTQITSQEITQLPEQLRNKIKWENKSVTISDEILKEKGSLKEALKNHLPLNRLIRLDLTGCQSLTMNDFHHLVDLMNLGTDNPARLNISELILTNSNFNALWFNRPIQLLGNLNQVVLDNPKAIATLSQNYPTIHFQTNYAPLIENLDVDQSLSCLEGALPTGNYLQHRTMLELFGKDCRDQTLLREVLSRRLRSIDQEEYFDLQMTFLDDKTTQPTVHNLFNNQLYCQSPLFRNEKRAGGVYFKLPPTILNQNATPEASEIFVDLIKGKPLNPQMSLITAFEVAELVKPQTFDMPKHYENLLNYLYEQLQQITEEVILQGEIHEIISRAARLEDQKGIALLELRLNELLMNNHQLNPELMSNVGNLSCLSIACPLMNELIPIEMQLEQLGRYRAPAVNENILRTFDEYLANGDIGTISAQLSDLPILKRKVVIDRLLNKVTEQIRAELQLYS